MDIIVGGRGTGKTVELIKRSAETGAVIFVYIYSLDRHKASVQRRKVLRSAA